jgi:hypothetical protein
VVRVNYLPPTILKKPTTTTSVTKSTNEIEKRKGLQVSLSQQAIVRNQALQTQGFSFL